MKRTLCLLLSAALLTTPVAAASESSTADQRLSQVTQTVKDILKLDNSYTSFHGELQEDPLRAIWELDWTAADQSTLTVAAGEDGTIYRYQYNPSDETSSSSGQLPSFPTISREDAQKTAQTFIDQVLGEHESAELSESDRTPSLTSSDHTFSTKLDLYGLPTPISVSATVDSDTGELLRFSRADRYTSYVGTPVDPASLGLSAAPSVNKQAYDKATALLGEQQTLRLEYVLDDDRKTASLRYVPDTTDNFYVDAQTGKLVNLTEQTRELYDKMGAAGSADTAAESTGNGSLSEAEQAGIAQMEGVLSKETLDSKVRTWKELGLTDYTLSSCSYSIDTEDGTVYGHLRYTQKAENNLNHRYITVNAKTGEIEDVFSSYWTDEALKGTVSLSTAQKTAESFLSRLWPDQYKTCALYKSTAASTEDGSTEHDFVFCQKVNGYFFPANSIAVSVDARDGSITYLSRNFDELPTFDSADGLISSETAHTFWMDTFETKLGYLSVPEEAGQSADGAKLAEMGYPYVERLTLGFYLEQPTMMYGIDAKTGQPLALTSDDDTLTYSDLSTTWAAQAAQALASYRIGWLGGTLQPTKSLTQLDLMALLASVDGFLIDLSEEDAADQIYDYAIGSGLLARGDRNDDKLITRAELVKTILDHGGYGNAAQIPGIFRCTFTDANEIPDTYYGYAAIAQGLHMVSGDETGRFAANQTATREEAIGMLYQFMAS